ncbi:MAG: glycosyl hydrolase [Thermoguttaceae bacterium]
MRFSRLLLMAGLLLGFFLAAAIADQAAEAPTPATFSAPPASAKPWVYWFWLNGNISREGITADLEAMHRVGIGGVLIMEVDQGIPLGPVPFAGPKWRELFKYMVAEASRLGIEVDMNNDAGWNGSGGPWVKPEHAMQRVVWTETAIEGPKQFDGPLPQPHAVGNYYRDIAVLAFPTPPADGDTKQRYRIDHIKGKTAVVREAVAPRAQYPAVSSDAVIARDGVIDLTAKFDKQGHLIWDVPAGKWTVLRIGHTLTGVVNGPSPKSGEGLECDKLSHEAFDEHWAGLMGKIIADVGPEAGKTLTYTHIDSWENGSQNWTPKMREEFQRRRGYDMLTWLPVMTGRVVDNLEVSERFLWDLRKTIAELNNDNYAGRAAELAHQHGMKLSIEAYGSGMFDDISYGGRADSPMGEYWIAGGAIETLKEMASAGHVYGHNVVGAESFTAVTEVAKWMNSPQTIKSLGDTAFCEGINRFVFHRYAMQPWLNRVPGMTMGPWGIHYERTETWWNQTGPWHEYLARCNYLLRQGLFTADICDLQPEDAPNTTGFGVAFGPRSAYAFDACPAEAVLTRMKVEDGRLVLPDGMSYRLLVLPPSETMTPVLLAKIKELVEAGATVVGSKPLKSPSLADYPKCDTQLRQLVAELWGDCDGKTVTEHACGKGKVICGKTPEAVLAEMGVPADFRAEKITSQTQTSRYIHRAADGVDIYFVSNANPRAIDTDCTFRVKGKRPELWHPDTGRVEPVAVYQEVDGCTRIPIWFDASGSVFVVFRAESGATADAVVAISHNGKPVMGSARPAVKIVVKSAIYGVPGDAARTRNVTARVQKMARQGECSFHVARMAEDGDPAFNVVKTLTVEYTVDGKPCRARGTDPETIQLLGGQKPRDAEVRYDGGRLLLEAAKPGRYELKTASGKTADVEVPAPPAAIKLAGPWELQFPEGWDAPKSVTLDKLISWSKHPNDGVKYFSGTATYLKTVRLPAEMVAKNRRVYLDLGKVEVLAQVKLNGKDLGILWKTPFRIDVTDAVRAGDNTLEVSVTNNWVNRLIGDEQLPEDSKRYPGGNLVEWPKWLQEGKPSPAGRHTFTTWRHWHKDSPLMESGLLGPVKMSATECVEPAF